MKTRTEKATIYMNKHKAKKCIFTAKTVILKDLQERPARIHGSTCHFVTTINKRFRKGFFAQELMDIVVAIDNNYTQKQIDFYNWV